MGTDPKKPLPHLVSFADRDKALYVRGGGDKNAVDVDDVNQDQSPCYFAAGLAALVRVHPQPDLLLRHMIRINDDGSYTVTLYEFKDGVRSTRDVTIDAGDLRALADKHAFGLTLQPDDQSASKVVELWPMLLEGAYWKAFPDPKRADTNPATVMQRLTGLPSDHFILAPPESVEIQEIPSKAATFPRLSLEKLAAYQQQGCAITLTTFEKGSPYLQHRAYDQFNTPYKMEGQREPLHAEHAYFVTNVDAKEGTVTVQNPWGGCHKDIKIPFEDLEKVFVAAQVNPVKSTGTFVGGMGAYPKKEVDG